MSSGLLGLLMSGRKPDDMIGWLVRTPEGLGIVRGVREGLQHDWTVQVSWAGADSFSGLRHFPASEVFQL